MALHGIENEEAVLYGERHGEERHFEDDIERFQTKHHTQESSWEHEEKKGVSFMVKLFLFTFFIAVGSGAFLYYKVMVKPVAVDNAKIDIAIDTPLEVQGGQENKALISLSNNNSIDLESAVLTLSYDKGGTLGRATEKVTLSKNLGTVASHGIMKAEFPYTVFGQTGEEKKLSFTLSYQIKGSTGVFPKEEEKSVRVSTPPLTVSVEGTESVVSGSQVNYTVSITNPTATSSKESLLTLSFPASFSLIRVSEKESDKKYAYKVPVLLPGEVKKIKVIGSLTGKIGEKTSLRATVGKPEGQDEDDDTTIYSYFVRTITIAKPGLNALLTAETESGGSSLKKGERVKMTLVYKNESQNKISHITYSVQIPDSIDAGTVSVSGGGYFDSATRSLIWSPESVASFAELGAQNVGVVSFGFTVPPQFTNDSVPFTVSYSGTDATTHSEMVSTKDFAFDVRGSTDFSAYTLFYDIDSKHGGPIPPVVDKETYITGVLTISTETGLKDTKAVFSIPTLYVKWMGGVGTTSVSYDARSKMVSWSPGLLEKNSTASVRFMLLVKPSLVHVGSSPQISSQVVFTATDISTGEKMTIAKDPLSTAVKDAGSNYALGVVIK